MKVASILLAVIAAFMTTSNAVQAVDNRRYQEWSPKTVEMMSTLYHHARSSLAKKSNSIAKVENILEELGHNDIKVTDLKDEAL